MNALIDERVAAVQRARIDRLLLEGAIDKREADDARARVGQAMVLSDDSGMTVHIYGLSGAAHWTLMLYVAGAPVGMLAGLAVDEHMRRAMWDDYDVKWDSAGRIIAVPREVRT